MNTIEANPADAGRRSQVLLFGSIAGWVILLLGMGWGNTLQQPFRISVVILTMYLACVPETMVLVGSILDLRDGGNVRNAASRTCLILSATCIVACAAAIYHFVGNFLATLP